MNDDLIRTCEECEHTGRDVNEYPTYRAGRGTTAYMCDDYGACQGRKYSKLNKPRMVRDGAKQ